jgi:hypothetical protein
MIKKIFCFVLFTSLVGCATLPRWAKTGEKNHPLEREQQGAKTSPQGTPTGDVSRIEVAPAVPIAEEQLPTGRIFAKTIFEGVVKTSYVQLAIVDQADPNMIFQLIIGDKERQKNLPWKIQTVKPGYFLIELPQGQYHINSISIPVGTTLATEPMDITFEVIADKTLYLGTLKTIGTKEKIRFGGVPVIKPGFEYRIEFSDDYVEALQELQERFPELKTSLESNLLKIRLKSNEDNMMPKLSP